MVEGRYEDDGGRFFFSWRFAGVPTVVASSGFYNVKYEHFRFDMPGFNLSDYDQVWLFGFKPEQTADRPSSG